MPLRDSRAELLALEQPDSINVQQGHQIEASHMEALLPSRQKTWLTASRAGSQTRAVADVCWTVCWAQVCAAVTAFQRGDRLHQTAGAHLLRYVQQLSRPPALTQTSLTAQQAACTRQQMQSCSSDRLPMPLLNSERHAGHGMHGDWRTRLRLLQLSIRLLCMLLLSRGHHAGLDHDQLHDCLLMNCPSSQQLQTKGTMPVATG